LIIELTNIQTEAENITSLVEITNKEIKQFTNCDECSSWSKTQSGVTNNQPARNMSLYIYVQ